MPKRARRIITAAAVGLTGAALLPTIAFAQEEADPVATLAQNINLLWVVIGAVLVIFMQAGFALVETGFCQAKHAAHVVTTNFAIFALGFIGLLLHRVPPGVRWLQLLGVRPDRTGRWTAARLGELGVPVGGRLGAER